MTEYLIVDINDLPVGRVMLSEVAERAVVTQPDGWTITPVVNTTAASVHNFLFQPIPARDAEG